MSTRKRLNDLAEQAAKRLGNVTHHYHPNMGPCASCELAKELFDVLEDNESTNLQDLQEYLGVDDKEIEHFRFMDYPLEKYSRRELEAMIVWIAKSSSRVRAMGGDDD